MKTCSKCRTEKGDTEFYRFKKGPLTGKLKSWCRECCCEGVREWSADPANRPAINLANRRKRARRKAELQAVVNQTKSVPCIDCKTSFHVCAMQFDHVRGVKKMDVSKMVGDGYPLRLVLEEMAKCDIVCANCHAVRTFSRRDVA